MMEQQSEEKTAFRSSII